MQAFSEATPKDAGSSRFHEQPWLPLLTEVRKFARNPPDWAWMREGLQTLITEPVYSVGQKSVSAATVKLVGLTIRALADQVGFVENITQDRIASYASVERSTVTRAVAVLNAVGLLSSHRVGRRRPASHAHNIGLLRTQDLRARAAADKRRDVASGHNSNVASGHTP